jgi:hypothetical protein
MALMLQIGGRTSPAAIAHVERSASKTGKPATIEVRRGKQIRKLSRSGQPE